MNQAEGGRDIKQNLTLVENYVIDFCIRLGLSKVDSLFTYISDHAACRETLPLRFSLLCSLAMCHIFLFAHNLKIQVPPMVFSYCRSLAYCLLDCLLLLL